MDQISVIVPVYNTEEYLRKCVSSICRQTYENLEILLIDDGSTDRCPEICEELAAQDSRIRVFHQKNAGQGRARNLGLQNACGTYAAFIDSDDWIEPDHLEMLYRALTACQGDVAIGAHTSVTAEGIQSRHPVKLDRGICRGDAILTGIVLPLIGTLPEEPSDVGLESSCCMNLYAMELIRGHQIRFVSERLCIAEDFLFNLDVLMHARCTVVTEETGYCYFENAGSTSRKYDPDRFERTLRFYDVTKRRLAAYALKNSAGLRLERTFLMKVRVALRHVVHADIPFFHKLRQIRRILREKKVAESLACYPSASCRMVQRILLRLMRQKRAWGIYLLMKLRDGPGRRGILKRLLHSIGIGYV